MSLQPYTHAERFANVGDPNRNIKNNYGSVILIGSGPSLRDHMHDLKRSNMPKLCMNNAIKLYTSPDFWCATDVHVPNIFPPWIWKHGCYKFVPDPHGAIAKYIAPRQETRDYLARLHATMTKYQFVDIQYTYDRKTFLTSPEIQLGHAWKDNVTQKVNGANVRSITSTFFLAFKLCIDLGFRTIYLVGVDLTVPHKNFYVYDTVRRLTRNQVIRETARMKMIRNVLTEQIPYLKEHQINVWNCHPTAGADMFPRRGFIRPKIDVPIPAPPPPKSPQPYKADSLKRMPRKIRR